MAPCRTLIQPLIFKNTFLHTSINKSIKNKIIVHIYHGNVQQSMTDMNKLLLTNKCHRIEIEQETIIYCFGQVS